MGRRWGDESLEGVGGEGGSLVRRLDLDSLNVGVEIVLLEPAGKRMRVLFVDGCRERVAERSVEKHPVASRVRGLGRPVFAVNEN